MRLLVTIAAIVSLTAHLLFGCCRSHVHVAAADSTTENAPSAQARHSHAGHPHHAGHGHGHSHAAADLHHSHPLVPGGPPVPHQHCQENDCVLLAAGKVLPPEISLALVAVVADVADEQLVSQNSPSSFAEQLFAPHVRSHLAHRVLRV